MAEATRGPTLRPMTVADLVDEIFRLYRADFGLLFGVAAIVWLPAVLVLVVLQFIFFGGRAPSAFSGSQLAPPQLAFSDLATSGVVIAIASIVGVIALPVLFGAITAAVSARYVGRPMTIDGAIRRGLACYWRMVRAYFLLFLAATAVVAIPLVAFLGVGVSPVFGVIGGVGLVAGLVASVWLTVTWAFVGQAIVIEDTPLMSSFGRSRGLVSGSRWRVIGINLLLAIVQAVLLSVPSALASIAFAPIPGGLGIALSQVTTALFQIGFYPVQFGTLALLYYDLRIRREGFDLTLAAERLPAT